MPDQDTWRFINTFAPWLSAFGSLLAVVTSLRLARRASRLDLRVNLAIVKMGVPGQAAPWQEFLQVRVVNHSREAVVKGIQWWVAWSKQQWIVLPPADAYSTKIPARLDFGEEALFLFPTATFNRDGQRLLEHLNESKVPQLTVRRLRAGIYTSTGQTFRVPLDAHMRRFMLERARQTLESGGQAV